MVSGGSSQRSSAPIPPSEPYSYGYPADHYYVVLTPAPHNPNRRRRRLLGYGALSLIVVALFCAGLYFLWPSDPSVQVVRLKLNHISFHTKKSGSIIPHVFMSINLGITVKVQNKDYFDVDYDYLKMGIGYRGREIGVVKSDGGYLSARSTTYVDATVDLNGIEVLDDVLYLLEDLSRGQIPLDTVTEIDGSVRIFFITMPLQEIMSCEIVVDPNKQTVLDQDCDPVDQQSEVYRQFCVGKEWKKGVILHPHG